MKSIILFCTLIITQVWSNFNFGECSGAGTFEQPIHQFKSYEDDMLVGEIPQGIKGLKIKLTSDKDVDIRLYGENKEKIVHWPQGILAWSKQETKPYKNTSVIYSGYNGVDGEKGHEFIEINGSTPAVMTMKAFGYQSGYATVNYSWTGKDSCTQDANGTGNFIQTLTKETISLVGTIPPHVKNVKINLTSDKDLDIQLYAEDGTAIASWKPTGLMAGASQQSIMYHDMNITWSGYNGTNGHKGNEYINIIGDTSEMLVMKVYGYESGVADVRYSWGKQVIDAEAIYISPDGDDKNNGTFDEPLKDTKKLCKTGTVLDNKIIYFKDGVYNNFPIIKCSGSATKPLLITPLNNEKVKFTFDGASGIRVDGNYIKLRGMEVEGVAQQIQYKDALANWWRGNRYYNGSGIVATGHHIEISDCVVHDIPSSGIGARLGDYINIHDNIVYNANWWTIAGSKGIGVIGPNATDENGYIKIENNLIFNVESRIYSRVWSKGFAHLDLDEGEGILVQINEGNYTGRYSIRNNFLLFDGKGIVVNKTNKADVVNNTLYHTGTTISGKFRGIRASLTSDSTISNNAVEIFGNGRSFSMGQSDISEVSLSNNCGNGQEDLEGVEIKDKIFSDANAFNFTPVDGCSGADLVIWNRLKSKADRLGIEISPTNWTPNHTELTKGVVEHIPEGATTDWSSWNDNEAFDLDISTIPDEGIKGRPEEFRLEIVHPYIRK